MHLLPKYIVVIPDKDLLDSVANIHDKDVHKTIYDLVNWLVCQISFTVRRKKLELSIQTPKIHGVCALHHKFNDALNDAAAKMNHRILTINSCNSYDHFDKSGNLSSRGMDAFWYELDELIKMFEKNKIKLLPNPKNAPAAKLHQGKSADSYRSSWKGSFRLPPPPPKCRDDYH